jgi:inositol 2-dehydrogenase
MTIRMGLIGAGRMGATFAHHLINTIAEAELLAIADAHGKTAGDVAARYGVESTYSDYNQLLERDDIDAVVIASPTNTHAEIIQAAAAAGKHIFCEKPLALTMEDCDAAIAAVEAAGVKLQLGFMRRFDAGYVAAKQKIEAGAIGEPVMFKSTGRDPRRTSLEFARRENSGGLIADMAAHDFDLARWLMGSEVERVYSEGGVLVYPELADVGDIDNAVVNLKFANGTIGNVDVSRNAVYGYDIRTEVLGSEGGVMISKIRQTPILMLTREGVIHDTVPYFMERFADAYAAEIRDFVACIVEDREPVVTPQDGRAAAAIGLAASISYDEGRPVMVSEVEKTTKGVSP